MRAQTYFKLFSVMIPVLLGLGANATLGQTTDCAQLLRYAGESWSTKSMSQKVDSAVKYFCDSRFRSEQEARAAITSAGFPIEAIPFKFTGNFTEDQFRVEHERFCHEEKQFNFSHHLEIADYNKLNTEVAKGITQCIALQATGLYVWLEATRNDNFFKVHAALRGTSAKGMLSGFNVQPFQNCTGTIDGQIGGSKLTKEVICERNPRTSMVVSVNSETFALQWVGDQSLPALPNWNCVYLPPSTAYTTEGDTRTSKIYTCPASFEIVPGSGRCMTTVPPASSPVSLSVQQGNSWVCHWNPPLAVGIGMWVEVSCRRCEN